MAFYTSTVGHFNSASESWENYQLRLESWMAVNEITEDNKKHVLIAEVGPETFALLKDLSFPAVVTEKSYKELAAMLSKHFKSSSTVMAERLKFHNRKQLATENLSDYIVNLKKLAAKCDFGSTLTERLRDTFTFGVKNTKIMKRLLEKSQQDGYTWESATTLALAMEVVDQDCGTGSEVPGNQSVAVNRLQPGAPSGRGRARDQGRGRGHYKNNYGREKSGEPREARRPSTSGRDCFRCGGDHNPEVCRYKDAECYRCHRYGHVQWRCNSNKNKSNHNRQAVKYVDKTGSPESSEHDSEGEEDFSNIYSLTGCVAGKGALPPEITVNVDVEGETLQLVVDTAAPVSVIPFKVYKKHFTHMPLKRPDIHLESYSQTRINVHGVLQVQVKYMEQNHTLPLYVVDGEVSLLGRQWLQHLKLNWNVLALQHKNNAIDAMDKLLKECDTVFAPSIGTVKGFQAEIKIQEGASPVFHRPRPVPYAIRQQVADELDRLEKEGIIEKINRCEWAAPIVVVSKADGGIRLCGDYKVTINPVIDNEPYPLPTAKDLFATLAGGEVFTKLDLSSAYQQLELTEASKKYLVINTQQGLYQYNRLSFGVSTAPNIFQKIMDQILEGLQGVTCYLDDILIATRKENHVNLVEEVLHRLKAHGLHVKRGKCEFGVNSVQYLGHKITAEGIRPTKEKVKAILNLKAPGTVKELRTLIGLVNYYAKFLPNLSQILMPWYELLSKEKEFKWTDQCEKALGIVKKLMTSDRLLVHYDPFKPLLLACDAGPMGVGCVLSHKTRQGERPIAFASRKLTAAEQNYCQLEKEALAIIYGLIKFHKYLFGRSFTIATDNKPISRILGPKKGIPSLAAQRLQRWSLILMSYNYQLCYRPSGQHHNCDALSRFPVSGDEHLASSVNHFAVAQEFPIDHQQIAQATRCDVLLSRVYELTQNGWPQYCDQVELKPYWNHRLELTTEAGCVLWGSRVVVPQKFRQRLLKEIHTDHPGVVRMKAIARSYFWYPGLDIDIESYVGSCEACQSQQADGPVAPLMHWRFPSKCWQRIHVDFAELEKKYYMIVVDAHSKWLEVIPMNSTTTVKTISELRKLFARFGLPEVVVSDNGSQFISTEFDNFLRCNGVKHVRSAPYHPATNGEAERNVQTFKKALKKHMLSAEKDKSVDMDRALQSFLFTYRTTAHATTGSSPAELMFKRPLRTRFSSLKPDLGTVVEQRQNAQAVNHDSKAKTPEEFYKGEVVRVKNYGGGIRQFVKGVIVERLGTYHYKVKVGYRYRKVHVEQLRKTREMEESTEISNWDMSEPQIPDMQNNTERESSQGQTLQQQWKHRLHHQGNRQQCRLGPQMWYRLLLHKGTQLQTFIALMRKQVRCQRHQRLAQVTVMFQMPHAIRCA